MRRPTERVGEGSLLCNRHMSWEPQVCAHWPGVMAEQWRVAEAVASDACFWVISFLYTACLILTCQDHGPVQCQELMVHFV